MKNKKYYTVVTAPKPNRKKKKYYTVVTAPKPNSKKQKILHGSNSSETQ